MSDGLDVILLVPYFRFRPWLSDCRHALHMYLEGREAMKEDIVGDLLITERTRMKYGAESSRVM